MAPAPKFTAEQQLSMILDAAAETINASSVADFTMAKIAKLAGLSMGSVYKFVQSKEDVILALACQSFTHASAVFKQVLNLPLTAPEKILAISLIAPKKLQLFDFDYELQSYATNEAIIKRGSLMWTDKLINASEQCQQLFEQSIVNAITEQERLSNPELDELVKEIIISSWSMCVGYEHVMRLKQTKQIIDETDSLLAPLTTADPLIKSLIRLLNSYPWQQTIDQQAIARIESKLTELNLR